MRLLFSLLITLSPTLPAGAQENAGGETAKTTGRLAWFVATSIPDDLENPVDVMLGENIVPVTLAKRMASEPVKIPSDGVIRLVRKGPDPAQPGETTFLTIAAARVPDGVAKALVILLPVPKNNTPEVFRTKVQDLAGFRGGDTLYMNLTKLSIAVRLGDARIGLKPGDISIHHPQNLSGATNTPVSYHFFHPTAQQWKLLSASTVVLYPTRREICIFSWDERFNRIDYHGITFPVTP